MKYYKYIRIGLILIPIVVLVFLVCKDFNVNGELKIDYDFCGEDAFVSRWSPDGRVLPVEKNNGDCLQRMVIDPVYFDVRLPQKFETAILRVWYKKTAETKLRIGPVINMENWQWQLKDINYLTEDNGWQVGYAQYDLKQAGMPRNRMRFMVSSSELDQNGEGIIFSKIEIELQKEKLNRENFWRRVKDWVGSSNFWFAIKNI